jgi:hypothetical protein
MEEEEEEEEEEEDISVYHLAHTASMRVALEHRLMDLRSPDLSHLDAELDDYLAEDDVLIGGKTTAFLREGRFRVLLHLGEKAKRICSDPRATLDAVEAVEDEIVDEIGNGDWKKRALVEEVGMLTEILRLAEEIQREKLVELAQARLGALQSPEDEMRLRADIQSVHRRTIEFLLDEIGRVERDIGRMSFGEWYEFFHEGEE